MTAKPVKNSHSARWSRSTPRFLAAVCAAVLFVGLALAQREEPAEPAPPYPPFGALVASIQSDGAVRVTATVYGAAPEAARITRSLLGGVPVATYQGASKPVLDRPEAGQRHVYRLEVQGRVPASAVVDLRPRSTLKFLGGTQKRAVFEVSAAGQRALRLIVRPGSEVAGAALDAEGQVREVVTGVTLLSTGVSPALVSTPRQSVVEDGTGKPVLGLDGQPLMLGVVERKASGASVMTASLKLGPDTLKLEEGQSLDLPLK